MHSHAGDLLIVLALAGALALPATRRPAVESHPTTTAMFDATARTSHDGRYAAELLDAPASGEGPQRWRVRFTGRDGRPLRDAIVTAATSMPETGRRSTSRASLREIGAGEYVVGGLAFPRPGWWNVALIVRGVAGTDSVAFNVVLPR